jgi:hypothetical protein
MGEAADFRVQVDPRKSCSAIEVTGDLVAGDGQRLSKAIGEATSVAPLRRIYLNSNGGQFVPATELWGLIRNVQTPVDTIVRAGSQCNSACVLLLMAGDRAFVDANTTILLHQAVNQASGGTSQLSTMSYAYFLVESGAADVVVKELMSLKPGQLLPVQPSNALMLGLGKLKFFSSFNPPATKGCSWPGFLR